MHYISSLQELRQNLTKSNHLTVGLVPTMGALHQGHLTLVERAMKENELTVCSIYVNPTQFNNAEDLHKYPRILAQDLDLLKNFDKLLVYAPSDEEMYPKPVFLNFNFGYLEEVMEGKFRPGHFNGVALIVSKLFNQIQPDRAYFGQKDLQQLKVIQQLVNDLSFPIDVISCETVREADGLAMSSRNRRLLTEDRAMAGGIFKTLNFAKNLVDQGERNRELILQKVNDFLLSFPDIQTEYFEITYADNLCIPEEICNKDRLALCMAAFLGGVRLIDNLIFTVS